jgi:hypothetical protein
LEKDEQMRKSFHFKQFCHLGPDKGSEFGLRIRIQEENLSQIFADRDGKTAAAYEVRFTVCM